MKKTLSLSFLLIIVLAVPLTSSALTAVYRATPVPQAQTTAVQTQSLNKITDANSLINRVASFGNVAVYLLVALAVVYIVWNVVYYLIRPEAADKKKAGMDILWGIVGLAIIVSLWGLVNIVVNTFSTDNTMKNSLPNANFISPTSNTNNDYGNELNH